MSAEELPHAAAPRSESADTRPEDLTFASVSRDGRRMIFLDAAGHEFSVQIDLDTRDQLAYAEPAPRPAPTAPVTPPASSAPAMALRPREIQTRIRAGESPEDVAAAAGTTVERIMGFAAPVIAEREHMAERAQRASLRRTSAEPGSARLLADAIAPLLTAHELGSDALTWDSSRRYDGRWNVTADYEIAGRAGQAEFVFDAKGSYVTLQNDDARWLVGEIVEPTPEPEPVVERSRPRDDLFAARQRRMAAAVEPLTEHESEIVEVTLAEAVLAETVEVDAYLEQPAEPEAPAEVAQVEEPVKPAKKKRTSVPSWDEIMFGGAK